jgi:3-hydroxyisobutyrate dehydrogenase
MKLINNFLNGVSLASAAEAMVVAGRAGLDLRQALQVINESSGKSWATENRMPRILEGDFLEGGLSSNLMVKDLVLYLKLVTGLQAPSLTGPASLAAFRVAESLGYGAVVSNHVVDALSELANGSSFTEAFFAPPAG